jgi:hypothetical protein
MNFVPIGAISESKGFIKGRTGLTTLVYSLSDDSTHEISNVSIPLYGVNYSSIFVCSNSFISFGTGSTAYGGFASLKIPALFVMSTDYKSPYIGYQSNNTFTRIRYEGHLLNRESYIAMWEVTIYRDGVIELVTEVTNDKFDSTYITDGVVSMLKDADSSRSKTFSPVFDSSYLFVPNSDFSDYDIHVNKSYSVNGVGFTPPPEITDISISNDPEYSGFSWKNPSVDNFAGVKIYDRIKGVMVADYKKPISSFMERNVVLPITKDYIVSTYDTNDNSSSGVRVSFGKDVPSLPNSVGQFSNTVATSQFPNPRKQNNDTVIVEKTSGVVDDDFMSLPAPDFPFLFYGVSRAMFIGTNSYLTFGEGYKIFNNFFLDSLRGVMVNASDNSSEFISYKKSKDNYTIRFEGYSTSSVSSNRLIWEITLFSDGVIQIHMINNTRGEFGTLAVSDKTGSVNCYSIKPALSANKSIVLIPRKVKTEGYMYAYGSYTLKPETISHANPLNISMSKNKISRETSQDRTYIKFSFDKDVTEWCVRSNGTSYNTGLLADSGGAVTAGQEITAEIDYSELYQEGQNRINIYGNVNGVWTPYEA